MRREDMLDAAAAARRELTAPRGDEKQGVEEVEELVLAKSRWFEEGRRASALNMRGYVGKIIEEKGDQYEVRLWRSSQGFDTDQRTHAPAWRRARDGKELHARRKEKGFSEVVSILVSREGLVADVRGRVVKGGVMLDKEGVAWRWLRGLEKDEGQGVVA